MSSTINLQTAVYPPVQQQQRYIKKQKYTKELMGIEN
jgi:hypothetical protein